MGAAEALVPERAGLAVGFDVGRLGAGSEGDGYLPHGVADMFGFE